MKKKLLFLLALLIIGISSKVQAYGFSAGAPSGQILYFNITSATAPYKAYITCENISYPYNTTKPRGNLIIPSAVLYDGITFTVDSIGISAFEGCSGLTSVTIPNTITSIGNSAFYDCIGLTSITIPNSVTSISPFAFAYCYGLTSITIPNSIKTIGQGAFVSCEALTSISIPNSVTSIGIVAFADCTGLDSIICEAINPPVIENNTFSNVDKTVPIYVPCGSLSLYQQDQYWGEFTNYKCLVGLDNEIETKVSTKIYPNPASDKAVLEFEGLNDDANVSVVDLLGRVIKEYKINKQDSNIEIDVRSFAKGVYNVVLRNDKMNITKKLIVR